MNTMHLKNFDADAENDDTIWRAYLRWLSTAEVFSKKLSQLIVKFTAVLDECKS